MGHFNSKLAREVGRLTDWREKVFGRRYQVILISSEDRAQIERLRYVLSHGCKEGWSDAAHPRGFLRYLWASTCCFLLTHLSSCLRRILHNQTCLLRAGEQGTLGRAALYDASIPCLQDLMRC